MLSVVVGFLVVIRLPPCHHPPVRLYLCRIRLFLSRCHQMETSISCYITLTHNIRLITTWFDLLNLLIEILNFNVYSFSSPIASPREALELLYAPLKTQNLFTQN